MRVASLVTGILSIVFCFVPVLGIILGIVAVCMGRSQDEKRDGIRTAGLTCGIIGLCLSAVLTGITACTMCAVL